MQKRHLLHVAFAATWFHESDFYAAPSDLNIYRFFMYHRSENFILYQDLFIVDRVPQIEPWFDKGQ